MLILFILNQVSLDFLLCPTCVCSITNGCYRPYKTWETGRRLIQAWSVFWHRYDSWLHIRRTAEQTLWVSVTVCIINSSNGVKPTWATIDSLTEPKEIKNISGLGRHFGLGWNIALLWNMEISHCVCLPKVSPIQHLYFVFLREKFTACFGTAGSAFSLLLVLKFIPKNTKAETTRGNTTGKTYLLLFNLMVSAV